ncbi:helix-turn-helix domain-containing protein [Herbaspirillum sp. AP21]|uniref:helix-turn-helix domain-containing protein n=1 Tax=unclassified Herbaspirillum TaxID=2624150 RepID=UPI003519F054
MSIREISLRLDISRNTVRRYIRSGAIKPSFPSRQSSSVWMNLRLDFQPGLALRQSNRASRKEP